VNCDELPAKNCNGFSTLVLRDLFHKDEVLYQSPQPIQQATEQLFFIALVSKVGHVLVVDTAEQPRGLM
jgi:hypothetical protein